MTTLNKEQLFQGLGVFIEAVRPYIVTLLTPEHGERWPAAFVESLGPQQKDSWNLGIKSGSEPVSLIDFQYLKSFAVKHRDLLRKDFGKDTNKLPTWLEEIAEVRNRCNHFQEVEEQEIRRAFENMQLISRGLKMTELTESLQRLMSDKKQEVNSTSAPGTLRPWFHVVRPHLDIRQGQLDESVFAANLAEVALGNGREIYSNPTVFFSKTFFTAGLKTVAKRVIKGLNGEEDAENRVISLQTGFGGGKTHTLISLYHLAKIGKKDSGSQALDELFRSIGSPVFDTARIAVFTNTTNDPAQGRVTTDNIQIHTMWGEIAYQLGGKECYEVIRANDESLIAPAGIFKKVLEKCQPALILVDELADYCVKASARTTGGSTLSDQTISFMQELTESVSSVNHCVLVTTLPASPQEVASSPHAQQILDSLQKRVSRIGADTKPVADEEIYEVIRRRLFEDLGIEAETDAVVSAYMQMYQALWADLPSHCTKTEYKEKLKKSYPFHPELIDVFRTRWASHHDFQRTRGVLRLLASIISDLWKRQSNLTGINLLIHPGDVNFANLDALSGQLKKLYGNGYDAVLTADVSGSTSNAFKIDSDKIEYGQYGLTQGLTATMLLCSFGSDGANKGVSVPELKLALLKPNGFNHNSVNGALDELEAKAHYLYYTQSGSSAKRYWFHTKPNINILINQAKGDINNGDIEAEILRRLNSYANRIDSFRLLIAPTDDVPEQLRPAMIVLAPSLPANTTEVNGKTKPFITKYATKKGNSDRVYRNTILFLVCSEIGLSKLNADTREYLASKKIDLDYSGQLEKEQREDIRKRMEASNRNCESSLAMAYSIVVKHSAKNGLEKIVIKQFRDNFESQFNQIIVPELKSEEWLLDNVGLGLLKNNNLIPKPLAPVRLKDVSEAFLRYDDKPMVTGADVVQNSVVNYIMRGEFGFATGDGKTFSNYYFKDVVGNHFHIDSKDESCWLVDRSDIPVIKQESSGLSSDNPTITETPLNSNELTTSNEPTARKFTAINVSGKVPLANYTDLFNYFITPFAMNGNKIEVSVHFKIHSSEASQLDESKQQYKNAKEAAKQLGLKFEEEGNG